MRKSATPVKIISTVMKWIVYIYFGVGLVVGGNEIQDDDDYSDLGSGVLPEVPLKGDGNEFVQRDAFISALLCVMIGLLLFMLLSGAVWLWRNWWGWDCRAVSTFPRFSRGYRMPSVEMEMDYYRP